MELTSLLDICQILFYKIPSTIFSQVLFFWNPKENRLLRIKIQKNRVFATPKNSQHPYFADLISQHPRENVFSNRFSRSPEEIQRMLPSSLGDSTHLPGPTIAAVTRGQNRYQISTIDSTTTDVVSPLSCSLKKPFLATFWTVPTNLVRPETSIFQITSRYLCCTPCHFFVPVQPETL